MADFSFLNIGQDDDSLPGSVPGESQPYEAGTQNSFRKKSSELQMKYPGDSWNSTPEAIAGKQERFRTIDGNAYDEYSRLIDQIHGNYTPPEGPSKGLYGNWQDTLSGNPPFDKKTWQDKGKGVDPGELPNLVKDAANQSGQPMPRLDRLHEAILASSKARAEEQAKQQPQQQEDQQGGIVDRESTMDHAFTAAGLPRHEAIQSLTEMRRIVAHEGIDIAASVSPLSFIPCYTNLITHIFNPQVAQKMLGEMEPPKQEGGEGEPPASRMPQSRGGQQSTFGSDKLEQDPRFQKNQQMIQQQEDRHGQVVRELANSGTFKNVGDVLGFVLTSFILGPRVAGLFFSNMEKNGRLRDELNRLDHETTQLYHQQNSYIQLAQHARAMAASEDHQKQQELEQVRHNWAVEHYTRGARSAATLSPEDRQIHQALQASLKDHWTEVQMQDRKVKRMDAIQGRGDPRDPDYKFVQANLSKERAKLQQMEQTYQKWRMEQVAPWYRKRGIEMVDPSQGTALTEKTFAAPSNE